MDHWFASKKFYLSVNWACCLSLLFPNDEEEQETAFIREQVCKDDTIDTPVMHTQGFMKPFSNNFSVLLLLKHIHVESTESVHTHQVWLDLGLADLQDLCDWMGAAVDNKADWNLCLPITYVASSVLESYVAKRCFRLLIDFTWQAKEIRIHSNFNCVHSQRDHGLSASKK